LVSLNSRLESNTEEDEENLVHVAQLIVRGFLVENLMHENSIPGLGIRVWGSEIRDQGFGLGFENGGLEFGVWRLGFEV
jgi:hypothetical protein